MAKLTNSLKLSARRVLRRSRNIVEAPAEEVSLLLIKINMIPCILAQVVEGLSILQYRAGSLIQCQKFIQLAIRILAGMWCPLKAVLNSSQETS
jgi:hypothetical protein